MAVPLFNGDNTITVTPRDAVRRTSAVIRVRVQAGAPVIDIGDPEALLHLPAQGTFLITAVGRTPGGRESAEVTLTVLYDDSEPTIRSTRPAEDFCTSAETIQVEGDAVERGVDMNAIPRHLAAHRNRSRTAPALSGVADEADRSRAPALRPRAALKVVDRPGKILGIFPDSYDCLVVTGDLVEISK